MAQPVKKLLVDHQAMAKYAADLFVHYGIGKTDADVIVDSLIFADLRGVDTHGVMRLPTYLKRVEKGVVAKENKVSVVMENETAAVIDGGNYLGPVAATRAMQLAIEKAKKCTVSTVYVRNNQHYGACAYYSMMALEHNMLGFSATNTPGLMAPTGGRTRMVGNNPFSFAAPTGQKLPFVLDVAMSNVAGGKLILAEKNKQSIPLGWALDKDGKPTTDPHAGFAGGGVLLPIGGHKGYGMAVMFDILCGVLSGSKFGPHIHETGNFEAKDPMGTGHMMAAVNIDHIMGVDLFKRRMDALLQEIKDAPRAEGVDELLIPGEIEFRVSEKRKREGIPVSQAVFQEVEALGQAAGLGGIPVLGEVMA